ncbi:hypothetical protein [Haliovirga abyssi]|uniref:6-bladed beta-propeller n=1 Tax=Haliovirga abyssi TaxID=2996794 RepID=A0AAU9DFH4_9FUSO|nr:hypothetical protein [Haliovirga abyssi]BDU51167.1 hypothetical protein HLVA_17360 [Haliovirga abyssi]
MKPISDYYNDGKLEIFVYEFENKVVVNNEELKYDFNHPRCIEYGKNKIYISDSYNNRIVIYDIDKKEYSEFGKGILSEPYGMKIYRNKIYIINSTKKTISIFDEKNNFLKEFKVGKLYPIKLDIYNNKIYVLDKSSSEIYLYDFSGEKTDELSIKLKFPSDIKVLKGNIYIADTFNKRVIKLSDYGILLKTIIAGDYYSILNIEKDNLWYYCEKKSELNKLKISLNKDNVEEILKSGNRKEELLYYYIRNENKEKTAEIYNKSLLNKKYKNENKKLIEFIDEKNKKELYKILNSYYWEMNNEIKEIKSINKIDNLKLSKPKAICVEDENIWLSLIGYKLLLKFNKDLNFKDAYKFEILFDKIAVNNKTIFIIDYYYKKVYLIDKENFNTKKVIKEKTLVSPVELKLYNEKLYVLDSYYKKIFIFTKDGSKKKEYKINGENPISFEIFENNIYVLDKKNSEISKYNRYFELEYKKKLNGLKYPESIVSDEYGNFFISDEGNGRVIKFDKNWSLLFEIGDFGMPRDLFFDKNKLYVSDFAKGELKIINMER